MKNLQSYINESFYKRSELEADLRNFYEKELERLHLFQKDEHIEINTIVINPQFRGKGIASEIIEQIVAYANKRNMILTLTPNDTWGSSVARLKKFYKRFGFESNRGRNRNFKYMDTMIKYPEK